MLQGSYQSVLEARNRDEFRAAVVKFAQNLGFNTVSAMSIRDRTKGPAEFLIVDNTPTAYLKLYTSVDIHRRDPVMQHCKISGRPIVWDQSTYVKAGHEDLWEQQAPYGYCNGISMALHMPNGRHFLVGVDRDQALPKDPQTLSRLVADLQVFTVYAQETAARVLAPLPPEPEDRAVRLTPCELGNPALDAGRQDRLGGWADPQHFRDHGCLAGEQRDAKAPMRDEASGRAQGATFGPLALKPVAHRLYQGPAGWDSAVRLVGFLGESQMLQDNYQSLMEVRTRDEFQSAIVKLAQNLGFNTVSASSIFDRMPGLVKFITVDNTPTAYLSIYNSAENYRRDPVMQHCKTSSRAIIWDQATYVKTGYEDQWEQQAAHGYCTGIAMALHMPEERHFMIGVDRDQALPRDQKTLSRLVADLQLFAVYAQEAAAQVIVPPTLRIEDSDASLTPLELEILRWTLDGKTAWEVGRILSISETMAVSQANSAMHRLHCVTKLQAALKARRLGLLR